MSFDPAAARLEVVAVDAVRPHEVADPVRERNIERRLQEEGVLRDPLIVGSVPDVDGFVLLDGTNRRHALATLGIQHTLVQIFDYSDQQAIELLTWCHLAGVPPAQLMEQARTIQGIEVVPIPPLGVEDALSARDVLAVFLDGKSHYSLLREPSAPSIPRLLRALVAGYEQKLRRVDCDARELEERGRALVAGSTLVAFPRLSRSQVVTMAMGGDLIPSGISRHVLRAGRALRVNLPLQHLSAPDRDAANRTLREHLGTLQPRMYREPTILYDS